MKIVHNFPLWEGSLAEFDGMEDVAGECQRLGVDGLETIYADYDGPLPPYGLSIGYHLTFYADWVDFWLGDKAAVTRKFGGDEEAIRQYYGGLDRQAILDTYAKELARAKALGAEYVVFHVSDVSLEEIFSYQWLHTDEQVIDCAIECINLIMTDTDYDGAFLVENQWWPGLTFTKPALTQRLVDGIAYGNKGIMLDIGHLMSTNQSLRTQAQAADYVNRMLDDHGEIARYVRGVHLHQSLSGAYLAEAGFDVPDNVKPAGGTFWERHAATYERILQIDRHEPWTDPAIAPVIARIDPEWLNNELSAQGRGPHGEAVLTQMDTLRRGGLAV